MYWSLLRMKRKKVNLYGYKATQCPGGGREERDPPESGGAEALEEVLS